MPSFKVTGYIQIPVEVEVEADTVEEALQEGRELLDNGLGYEGDQYMSDNYYVATPDYMPVAQSVMGELLIEEGWE